MSAASSSSRKPLAAIFGLSGTVLSADERAFFRDADPLGFILFQRNCDNPEQVTRLVAELCGCVGRGNAPVLIDQEGGRVTRLKPPHWREYPSAALLAASSAPREAVFLGARLIADDLAALGITLDCMPVLDLPVVGADAIIGDRAYSSRPETVSELGRAACEGLLRGCVLPIIKHMPGHGRATVDSHKALPVVETSREELETTDFAPFRALRDMNWAMTAHIVYRAIDEDRPATLSSRLIAGTIRASIGFDGVLISDDLSMAALPGTLPERAAAALAAGCDLILHCNGDRTEMTGIAGSIAALTEAASRRVTVAEARRRGAAMPFDRRQAETRFAELVAVRA